MSFPIPGQRHRNGSQPAFIQQKLSSQESLLKEEVNADSIYGGVAASAPIQQAEATSQKSGAKEAGELIISPPLPQAANTGNWSASVQSVLDRPPSALPLQMILGGMAFCMAFGAWAMLGQIDEVGHAQGRLVPKGDVYKIDPVEMGQVSKIEVKEGQAVKAGQVLVELDTQIAAGEVERLQQMVAADRIQLIQKQSLIDKTRLEAKTRIAIANADAQGQEAAIAAVNAKISSTRSQLAELKAAIVASQDRLERLKPLAGTNQELRQKLETDVQAAVVEVERLKSLADKGAISRKFVLDAEQALRDRQSAITKNELEEDTMAKERQFEAEQSLRDRASAITHSQGELQQTLAEAQRLQSGLTQKRAEVQRNWIEAEQQEKQLEVEISQIKAKIAESQNMLNSAKAKLKQRFLYAPVDGVVSSLNIRNIGEVVQPGKTVAELAAENAPLVLSAVLPNREAGFVKMGMPVQLKFEAFPYQDYGIVSGKVVSISSDAKPDERLGAVYRVEVALDRNYIAAERKNIKFKAGQTATADIIIRRRRIADILLDPIRQLQKGGMSL